MTTCHLAAIVDKDSDGYFAFCQELQGCYTQGNTFKETLSNLCEVISLHLEDCMDSGDTIH